MSPFDYVKKNIEAFNGVRFELEDNGEGIVFRAYGPAGNKLSAFDIFPFVPMLCDTFLNAHPCYPAVSAVLADFCDEWAHEFDCRESELN